MLTFREASTFAAHPEALYKARALTTDAATRIASSLDSPDSRRNVSGPWSQIRVLLEGPTAVVRVGDGVGPALEPYAGIPRDGYGLDANVGAHAFGDDLGAGVGAELG